MAAHRDAKDLIEIGAYVRGTNPLVDRALGVEDEINAFLRQDMDTTVSPATSWLALQNLVTRSYAIEGARP